MGGSTSTPSSTTSLTRQVSMPVWLTPYAKDLTAQGMAAANRPFAQYTGSRVANPSANIYYLDAYRKQAQAAAQGGLDINQARQQFGQTAQGRYLSPSSNPWLRATYDQAANALTDQYMRGTAAQTDAAAARAGALGGSAYNEQTALNQYGLGQNLANLATNIYGGNYQTERDRQLQATGQLPGLAGIQQQMYNPIAAFGDLDQEYQQQMRDLSYANWREARDYPLEQLDILGSVLTQALGHGGQSTVSTQPYFQPRTSPFTSALGGALAGYGATNNYAGAGVGAALGALGTYF